MHGPGDDEHEDTPKADEPSESTVDPESDSLDRPHTRRPPDKNETARRDEWLGEPGSKPRESEQRTRQGEPTRRPNPQSTPRGRPQPTSPAHYQSSSGTRRDPVQETYEGELDLYEIATWEVRTPLDAFAVRLTNALESTKRWLLLIIAIGLFTGQLLVATVFVAQEPFLGLLAVFSALPALFLAGYFWYDDPTAREPIVTLAATFVLAVVFSSIAGVVNSITIPFFELFGIVGLTLFYFLIVGPIEETVKWLAVRVYAYRTDSFRTVVDGVVYGAMAGVGFAAIENLIYIITFSVEATPTGFLIQEEEAIAVATQRAFVGPGHVIFSAWAGFYLGLAKFNQGKRGPIVVKGLLIAAFIHALYNTLVTTIPLTLGTLIAFIVVFHGFWFALLYRKVRAYQELYKKRPPSRYGSRDRRY